MNINKVVRNTAAGVLIASMPISASVAATRPSAAVPAAAAAAQDYDYENRGGSAMAWPALAVIAATLLVGILIVVGNDDDGEGSLSRA